ncbi:MAG: hypothetical protein AVDCRST_MAG66-2167, partial [uncultured Pseudonocardia sp.]
RGPHPRGDRRVDRRAGDRGAGWARRCTAGRRGRADRRM